MEAVRQGSIDEFRGRFNAILDGLQGGSVKDSGLLAARAIQNGPHVTVPVSSSIT